MDARQKFRSGLSALLMTAILSCAQTGLAKPVVSAHAMQCGAGMSHSQQHAMPSSCKHHRSAAPCCPSHPANPSSSSADQGCCKLSNQPAQPLAFVIVSRAPLALEANPGRSANLDLDLLRRSRNASPISDSLPFTKPVFDQKADLRI
jgi:hypothetical protein